MSDATLLSPFIEDLNVQKLVVGGAIGCALLVMGSYVHRRLGSGSQRSAHVIPDERPTLVGVLDVVVEGLVSLSDSVLGKVGRKFIPFTGAVFLFILLANLVGLIPGMPAVTTTVWINVGISFAVFLYFNYQGIREQGLVPYIKHFAGPVWWLAWFIFPVELVSITLRILTLNLRLYWNITADHMVLHSLTDLFKVLAAPVFLLGTFVCFMQAFIFTILTMLYLLFATEHEHHGDEAH
jgi:F-type H+-transporting ATPase subunit a